MYVYLQYLLGGIGRFQVIEDNPNRLRYIISDKKGILKIINLIQNKLRTPKNKTLNKLIEFLNDKYSLNISYSVLDTSDISSNNWLTGFCESDASFSIKVR